MLSRAVSSGYATVPNSTFSLICSIPNAAQSLA
jgi:hypothetical protein